MLGAVAKSGFLYDSSIPVGWACGGEFDSLEGMKEAMISYGVSGIGTHFPTVRGKMVEMPVAIPDDEILIDRLNITETGRMAEAFAVMTDSAIESGGHLVLQLHPERFHLFEKALGGLLEYALDKGAWVAPLRDVARWCLEKPPGGRGWPEGAPCAMSVTGDIDAVTIGDFLARRLGR
jgi:hypothetical protein